MNDGISSLVKALLVRSENTISFSLTLLRDLQSFENWRGGEEIRGGGIPPAPLATALNVYYYYVISAPR